MHSVYTSDGAAAVRSQRFIRLLHEYLAGELERRLSSKGRNRGIRIGQEVHLFGSHKPKDVDVAVVDPDNGPLLIIGVRSQMSSVGKNALTYYQDIIGECISLQQRFPLATYGYVYLHPLKDRDGIEPTHARYARMYDAITDRFEGTYRDIQGKYDHFAYMIVDFESSPPKVRNDKFGVDIESDLDIETFVDRMIATFCKRNLWIDIFE